VDLLLLVEKRRSGAGKTKTGLWIVDYCGGCSRFLVATRSRPAFAHPPGPRICGRSPIAASWIAGLLDPPPTSEVPRLTQPPPRSIHSPASARRAFNAFKRVASPKTTDGEKTHSAAPHPTAPVQSTPDWRNWKRLFSTPRTKQVQGWKSRTHERRPVPTLTGASQQPGGVFLPILLQPGHTLFKVLQTNRSSC
jgi:hypothetical protein